MKTILFLVVLCLTGLVRCVPKKYGFNFSEPLSHASVSEGSLTHVLGKTGQIYTFVSKTGMMLWKNNVTALLHGTNLPKLYRFDDVRLSVWNGMYLLVTCGPPARLLVIDRLRGTLTWVTTLASHFAATADGGGALLGDLMYVGMGSSQKEMSVLRKKPCCDFVGSVAAVNLRAGQKVWQTDVIPKKITGKTSMSGAEVSSFPPVASSDERTLYVTTEALHFKDRDPSDWSCWNVSRGAKDPCFLEDPNVTSHSSVIALRAATGAKRWVRRFNATEAWNLACVDGSSNCPSAPTWDSGFSNGVSVAKVCNGEKKGATCRDVVYAVQNTGILYALDAATGELLWHSVAHAPEFSFVKPGNPLVVNDNAVYDLVTNPFGETWIGCDGSSYSGSGFSVRDALTGECLDVVSEPAWSIKSRLKPKGNGIYVSIAVKKENAFAEPWVVSDASMLCKYSRNSDPKLSCVISEGSNVETYPIVSTDDLTCVYTGPQNYPSPAAATHRLDCEYSGP